MNISEQIENDIITLKEKRYSDEKIKQYDLIASRIGEFLKNTKTKKFQKSLIISFFSTRFYPLSTQRKHIKNIIDVMKDKGLITDGKLQKIGKQQRVYSLSSDDKQSYSAMMKANGFNSVEYFKYYCDKDGIPRRRKIATSKINDNPKDENGEILDGDDWDISVLKQTIPRTKQGVKGRVFKSIAFEQRRYTANCFIVL